jgi:hypothetical protein
MAAGLTVGDFSRATRLSVKTLREYYLRGTDTPDEAEWRTEIGWPIFRADASRA